MDIERLHAFFVLALGCNCTVAESVIVGVYTSETPEMFVQFVQQKGNALGLTTTPKPAFRFVLSKEPLIFKDGHRLPMPTVSVFEMTGYEDFVLDYSDRTRRGLLEFRPVRSVHCMKINNSLAHREEFYQAINNILECLAAGRPYPGYPHTIPLSESSSSSESE